VDVITGPGNIYVTLAKKLIYGTVGIDSLAGPSEVLIIADESANPVYIAADLLAQAEHDPMAAAILLTPDSNWQKKCRQKSNGNSRSSPTPANRKSDRSLRSNCRC
jgi:histidinol dehydrogenase